MPLHKLPLIKVSNVQENAVFRHKFWKISLPHPPPAWSLRSLALAPRWQGAMPPPPWLEWNNYSKEGGSRELVYVTSHNQPPNNVIQCARNVVFIHKCSKKSPYRGRGKTPLPTLPLLGHFAPLLWPPLTNPGCTTVTGIAKMHKGPCSPWIGVKEIFKRGNIYGIGTYATSHNYPLIM